MATNQQISRYIQHKLTFETSYLPILHILTFLQVFTSLSFPLSTILTLKPTVINTTDPLAEKNDGDLYEILQTYMSEHPTRGEVAIVDHIRSLGFRVKRKKLREQVCDAIAE